MSLTIQERGQKVAACIQERAIQTIQAIAAATGIPTSSVHRHRQAIA